MTELLFRDDAYAFECEAKIIAVTEAAVILDRTVMFATGGGQPGDSGVLRGADGTHWRIAEAVYTNPEKTVVAHKLAADNGDARPQVGAQVTLMLDAERRLNHMRMHTALHLLSVVLPFPVTGGSIGEQESRLDFDMPEGGLDKTEITNRLNNLIATNAPVRARLVPEAELDANPALVKTLSVKPPRGAGVIRLVEIKGLDLQPCGGTHVRNTGEIGPVVVTGIEKKGRQNRRVRIGFGAQM